MLRALRIAIPALLLPLAACARSSDGDTTPARDPGRVEVRVTNGNALPMEVSVFGSGIRHRMGTVHPGMNGNFVIPPNLVGNSSVEFEARPSGGGQPFRSGELLLASGTFIDFRIAAQLFNSTVNRR